MLRVLTDVDGAAAEIRVVDPADRQFDLAAFWHWREGLFGLGIEYWVDVGADDPPASRASSPDTRAAR